ncbi:MAG: vWA domain-containing protein [bacterium]|nr:vWA domain-containing protein [bacterium]
MQFEEIRWLFALLLVFLPYFRWRSVRVSNFSSFSILPKDVFSLAICYLRKITAAIAIVFIVIALANPISNGRMVMHFGSGASIVFVLDMSASMEGPISGGLSETRWKVAEDVVERFVSQRCPKDRVALIGFGSMPIIFSNLTSNCRAFVRALKGRGDDLSGTVIGWPLANAAAILAKEEIVGSMAPSRVIVLVSDGGGSVENRLELASIFTKSNIKFYWVSIGNDTSSDMAQFMDLMGPARSEKFVVNDAKEFDRAFKKIDALTKGIVRYETWQPRSSFKRDAIMIALGATVFSILFAMFDFELRKALRRRKIQRGAL